MRLLSLGSNGLPLCSGLFGFTFVIQGVVENPQSGTIQRISVTSFQHCKKGLFSRQSMFSDRTGRHHD
jgi:hypothetical protein